jgi:hypothetical protein
MHTFAGEQLLLVRHITRLCLIIALSVDVATGFLRFDRPRALRVLARIAADLDELARRPLEAAEEEADGAEDPHTRHRRRIPEPDAAPRGRTQRE